MNERERIEQIEEMLHQRNTTPDGPRAWTVEEMRDRFMKQIWDVIRYWERETIAKTVEEKVEGTVFSVLSCLDGDFLQTPAFRLIPHSPSDDKDYYKEYGENWWAEEDIGGALHEMFHRYKNK